MKETTFFDTLEKLCEGKGISPTAFAKSVGLGEATVNGWRKGSEPRASTLKKASDFFGVSIEYLKTGENPVITGRVETNNGIIGHNHAPVTIVNGSERPLSKNEIALFNMFHELGPMEQAKALVYVEELYNKAKK